MGDPYAVNGRDGVFSRPYEPGRLPRELARLGRRLSGEGGGRVRVKQDLDLVPPERVKMEPEESLEYYYAATAAASAAVGPPPPTLDSFAYRQQSPRPLIKASPPPERRECHAYNPLPPDEGFAAFAATAFREAAAAEGGEAGAHRRRLDQAANPFHKASLTLHLKEEAREEAEREGGGRSTSGPPPAGQADGLDGEENKYGDHSSEMGSSRTVIGGFPRQEGGTKSHGWVVIHSQEEV